MLGAFLLSGCGSGGQLEVYPVKGRITYNGKPMVGGGAISIIPQGSSPSMDSGGEIGTDGSYELTTYKPGDGAVAGEYRVVITQTVFQEPKNVEDGAGAAPEAIAAVPVADRVPAIYSDFSASPLKAQVKEESNELNFELTKQ
jgi:hypothetical protein